MFVVSFNNEEYEIGGFMDDGNTEDYYGPDMDRLAAHVCSSDENYPLTFKQSSENDCEVGYFYDDDGDITAVMYTGPVHVPEYVA